MSNHPKKARIGEDKSLIIEPLTKDAVWLEIVDDNNELSNKPYGAVTLENLKHIDTLVKRAIKNLMLGDNDNGKE